MDEEVRELIKREEKRQEETITLIPSENYASKAVRGAMSSMLNNKYSEGYPGKRYYQGNKIIDQIEQLAIDRAKELFNVPHVNVQPYSGSPANAALLLALVTPGETLMGMKLSAGGHLTHGHPEVTFSGKFYKSVQYDVDAKGLIDYEELISLAREHKPKLILAGTTAYPRILEWKKFRQAADEAGAYLLADISHIAGLVTAGVHESPVEYADVVMTTTHKTLRGPRGAMLMVTEKGLKKDPEMARKIDRAVFPGIQGGPHNAATAAMAVAFGEALKPEYKLYIQQVVTNARVLAEKLVSKGFNVCTGGTDNHLMVVDLRNKGLAGKDVAETLEEAGIIVNANAVPHDPNPPGRPSGIRLGTPAVTTRGMGENEMIQIAEWIDEAIIPGKGKEISEKVRELGRQFPVDR